jgi:hypothetical protein
MDGRVMGGAQATPFFERLCPAMTIGEHKHELLPVIASEAKQSSPFLLHKSAGLLRR